MIQNLKLQPYYKHLSCYQAYVFFSLRACEGQNECTGGQGGVGWVRIKMENEK
jgi:hypothetical protein